ncbi:unnamed protein product [Toxocara canis]|uniref:Portal protein n=1 Tax=Toxocara canis TaxID=6265 RepID=A0A183TX91_TOXCA|nr:unnamed protein product [Toxocara canis]
MIDSEDLRAILEAQEERQHQMLKAVTANQQQQALLEQVGRVLSAIGPTASPAPAAEFVANSLSTWLPEFIYDPDNGCTFDVWINRYEDVIVQDGSTVDEAAKALLIISTLMRQLMPVLPTTSYRKDLPNCASTTPSKR